MFNFLVLIVAAFVFVALSIVGFLYEVFFVRKKLSKYFWGCASTLSQFANFYGRGLWNRLLIKDFSKHRFGNPDESISGVLGKNNRVRTLTRFGGFMVFILDKLEPKHTELSIEEDES